MSVTRREGLRSIEVQWVRDISETFPLKWHTGGYTDYFLTSQYPACLLYPETRPTLFVPIGFIAEVAKYEVKIGSNRTVQINTKRPPAQPVNLEDVTKVPYEVMIDKEVNNSALDNIWYSMSGRKPPYLKVGDGNIDCFTPDFSRVTKCWSVSPVTLLYGTYVIDANNRLLKMIDDLVRESFAATYAADTYDFHSEYRGQKSLGSRLRYQAEGNTLVIVVDGQKRASFDGPVMTLWLTREETPFTIAELKNQMNSNSNMFSIAVGLLAGVLSKSPAVGAKAAQSVSIMLAAGSAVSLYWRGENDELYARLSACAAPGRGIGIQAIGGQIVGCVAAEAPALPASGSLQTIPTEKESQP